MIKAQKGFTLIELMAAVAILAILAAIAIPSYKRYIIKNAEDEVKAQMGQLELQLASWRASALTYRGFVPINGTNANGNLTYGYSQGRSINIPLGSTAETRRYQIEIVDGGVGGAALNANNTFTAGRSWIMIATPNSDLVRGGAKKIAMTSSGVRCQTKTQTDIGVVAMQQNPVEACNNKESW